MAPHADGAFHALAIDTSGRVGSAAIGRGDIVLEARTFSTTRRHAAELLPVVENLCRDHALAPDAMTEVYVSGGPGSFTGLRIGITFARGLALARGAKVVRVPTLDAIAQNALDLSDPPVSLAVILDAKQGRVFAARYRLATTLYERIGEPAQWSPDELLAGLPRGCAVLGEGIAFHREAIERAGVSVLPDHLNRSRAEVVYRLAYALARAGRFDNPADLVPIYIRRPEAEEVWEKRHEP